jgi:LuxR family maltose regulon positive regulatory protein
MAEARTTPSAAAAEQDLLVATKLHRPQPRPCLVPRPRLTERLDQGIEGELVLISTPAGFGKTTLMAHWAATTSWPVAWLSLDEGDNDPARFWRHAAAALTRVRPGVGERATALLGGPSPPRSRRWGPRWSTSWPRPRSGWC